MKPIKTPTLGEIKQRIRDMRSPEQKRKNKDGSFSTHLMSYEGDEKEGYLVYPTIFPNEDGSWTHYLSDGESDENWEKTYQEAKKRGEVIRVPSKLMAEDLAAGSWKPQVKVKKKPIPRINEGTRVKKSYKNGGSFKEYYQSLPPEKRDTSMYNLRRAFELAPKEELAEFANNPKAHLRTFYFNKEGVGEFMKSPNHPTTYKELDFYYSDKGKEFRSKYDLVQDKSGYKYVPKKK
jgi:hypothetical protein